jgi:hypothetical protein
MQTEYDLENLHKWLNEETNKEIDKQALARLLWYVRCSLSTQGSADFDIDSEHKLIQKALEIGLENTIDLMTDHLLNSKEVNQDYINILRKEEELIIQALEVLEGKNK